MFGQSSGPSLEGGRLGWQLHRLSLAELSVGGLQILQQDAPGDAVDRQVMYHDQQPAGLACPQVKVGCPQQRPHRQVQAGLYLYRCCLKGWTLLLLR